MFYMSTNLQWLQGNTILLTLAGSHAYGMNTPSSDLDLKGVAVAPIGCYLGFLDRFEQADKSEHLSGFQGLLRPEHQEVAQRTKLEGTIFEVRKLANQKGSWRIPRGPMWR